MNEQYVKDSILQALTLNTRLKRDELFKKLNHLTTVEIVHAMEQLLLNGDVTNLAITDKSEFALTKQSMGRGESI